MTNIVERLHACHGIVSGDPECYCEEAADEIERLQSHAKSMVDALNADIDAKAAENERLRAALESLTKDPDATLDEPDPDWEVIVKMRAIARAALEPKS